MWLFPSLRFDKYLIRIERSLFYSVIWGRSPHLFLLLNKITNTPLTQSFFFCYNLLEQKSTIAKAMVRNPSTLIL